MSCTSRGATRGRWVGTRARHRFVVPTRRARPARYADADRSRLAGRRSAFSSVPGTKLSPDTCKRLSLLAAIMGSFVAFLDSTVVNVALPAIERDLGGGLAGQQWVVNAYLLVLGSLILVGGRLGDVFGERRVFSLGVAGFGAVSIVCALAPSIEVLVAARALQGAFGALLTPSALAVIVSVFGPSERGAAIGSWTAWVGIAGVLGPLAGGQIVDVASWRWIFAVNVPFVIATLALVAIAVPAREIGEDHPPVDWLGGLLCALGLAGPVYALIRQPALGWGAPGVIAPFVAGFALLAAFLLHEARTPQPMLPLALFRRRNFAIGNAQTLTMYAGLSVLSFFLILFLQQVAGWSAIDAGMAMLPTTLIMFGLSRYTGRLADRYGPRAFMGGGPLVAAAGLALMQRLGPAPSYVTDLLPALIVFSLGLALTVAPLTATVLADADEHNAGIASGVNNAIARVAGLLGIAAIGAIVAAQFASTLDGRLDRRQLSAPARAAVAQARSQTLAHVAPRALPVAERVAVERATEDASVSAFHLGIGIAAGLVAAGGVLGLVGIANPRRFVCAAECPGGQIAGAPREAARAPPAVPVGAAAQPAAARGR
jgi:EmrB/QacA subfamily drug resistance transporter